MRNRTVLFLIIVCLFLVGKKSIAQEPKVALDVWVGSMGTSGATEQVGSVVEYSEYGNWKTGSIDYNFKHTPLVLQQARAMAFYGSLSRTLKNGYRFGIRGLAFKSESALQGTILTPASRVSGDYYWFYYNWLQYWGNSNLYPLINTQEPGYASPIEYSAKSKIGLTSVDIFGTKRLTQGLFVLDVYAAIKIAKPSYSLELGMGQHAYFGDKSDFWFDNMVTITNPNETRYGLLIGPMIGLDFERKWKAISASGWLHQGAVAGPEEDWAVFRDVDDINTSEGPILLDGYVRLSDKQTRVIPVTDFGIKLAWHESEFISFGGGFFSSVYWNMPSPPLLMWPWGSWADGLYWKQGTKTLLFYGVFITASAKF